MRLPLLPPLGPSPPALTSRDSTHSSTSAASSPRTERRSHPLAPAQATEVQLVRRPPGKSAHLPHHVERRSRGRRSKGKASPAPYAVRARVHHIIAVRVPRRSRPGRVAREKPESDHSVCRAAPSLSPRPARRCGQLPHHHRARCEAPSPQRALVLDRDVHEVRRRCLNGVA